MQLEDEVRTEYMAPGETANADAVSNVSSKANGTVLFTFGANQISSEQEAAPRDYYLVRERTGEKLRVFPPAIIGRGAAATTKVRGNLAISREHARVQLDRGRLTILDLGSVNGTSVRGSRIPNNKAVEIRDGDEVRLASEVFRVLAKG